MLKNTFSKSRVAAHIHLPIYTQFWQTLRESLPSTVKMMAIVKANAYGLGAIPISQEAIRAGVNMLGVATQTEAIELKLQGIQVPVLILSQPVEALVPQLVKQGVHWCVYTLEMAEALQNLGLQLDVSVPIHIKVDTGMNRLGVFYDQALAFVQQLQVYPNLDIVGIMTHFCCADAPEDRLNQVQHHRFQAIVNQVKAKIPEVMAHAANSDATLNFPEQAYDMVRVGLASYRACISLKSQISFLKKVPAHERVSYGGLYETSRDTWLATLPIGYEDGIVQNYGLQGGRVLIGGQLYPIVGRVCMDMLMVDLGENPHQLQVAAPVVVIGSQGNQHISLAQSAAWAQRSEYEQLCGIGNRVERNYFYR